MTFYKCVNDIFGYCSSSPERYPKLSEPNPGGPNLPTGGRCRKNLEKCGSYVTNSQKCEQNPHKSRNTATERQKKATKKKK